MQGIEVEISFKAFNYDYHETLHGKGKADCVDVIEEKSDYFKGYEKDVERKLREAFGILEIRNWRNYCGTISTIATEVIAIANYGSETDSV